MKNFQKITLLSFLLLANYSTHASLTSPAAKKERKEYQEILKRAGIGLNNLFLQDSNCLGHLLIATQQANNKNDQAPKKSHNLDRSVAAFIKNHSRKNATEPLEG